MKQSGGSMRLSAHAWLAEYLHEMTVFPNGKHDDQVDSTAQFLEWLQKPFSGQNVFEYYRKEAEKLELQRAPENGNRQDQ